MMSMTDGVAVADDDNNTTKMMPVNKYAPDIMQWTDNARRYAMKRI